MLPRDNQKADITYLPWGVTAMILLKLSDTTELTSKTTNRDAGALISTCRQMRDVSLRLRGEQFFGRYYYLSIPGVKEAYESGMKINNYYALNMRLKRLINHRSNTKEEDIDKYGVFCLTGQMDLVELVVSEHICSQTLSAERRFYLCNFAALSESAEALYRIADAVSFTRDLIIYEECQDTRGLLLSEVVKHGSRKALRNTIEYLGSDFVTEYLSMSDKEKYINVFEVIFKSKSEGSLNESKGIFLELLPYCTTLTSQLELQQLLCECIRGSEIHFIEFLMSNGVAISDDSLIETAELGKLDVLKSMLNLDLTLKSRLSGPSQIGYRMMSRAAMTNVDVAYLEFLIDHLGLNINGVQGSSSALHGAVLNGKSNGVFAWVMARKPSIEKLDENLMTPLQAAFESSNLYGEVPNNLTVLIQGGANINFQQIENKTALHFILSSHILDSDGKLDLISNLILKGSNVNAESNDGSTPISLALKKYNDIPDHFWKLVATKKIDMNLDAHFEILKDPFLLAAQKGMVNLVKFLMNNGANLSHTCRAHTFTLLGQTNTLADKTVLEDVLKKDGVLWDHIDGFTALDLAICFNREEVVKEMVNHFPLTEIKNLLEKKHIDQRLTTYDLAKAVGNAAIIDLLDNVMRSDDRIQYRFV